MKKLVVLSGAGMSAESGIKTFRDADGLWEGHDVMQVASPMGFEKNPSLVYEFYNQRRRQLNNVEPNQGHLILADLEKEYEVEIITQNVDDLHERAGSSNVMHLHGELKKARSTKNSNYVVSWNEDLDHLNYDPKGYPMRPHIVWFGEAVPLLDDAISIISNADIVAIIGTSLQVYPAANLFRFAPDNAPIFYIDPNPSNSIPSSVKLIKERSTTGLATLKRHLKSL